MSRKFGNSLIMAVVALGVSLAMISPANAFHGGSHGGSFGGLFHRHHGSSGGYDSQGCSCDCDNANDANEGSHEDNGNHHNAVSDRDDRVMEAPSRDVHRNANGAVVGERDRDRRHHDDKDADHKRDGDKNHDKDVKKDKDTHKDKDEDDNKKEESKK